MKTYWMILAVTSFACSEKKASDPWVNICPDLAWMESVKGTIIQNGWKGEIYLSNYQDERVFEVNGCVDCADFVSQLQNCDGDTICEMGGIAGFTCPGYAPEADERLLYWKN
jgi:hypothetical protein